MSQAGKVDPGRVDQLGLGVFKHLVKRYANPHMKFAVAMLEPEIEECFQENLGPGTNAEKVGRRLLRALGDGK